MSLRINRARSFTACCLLFLRVSLVVETSGLGGSHLQTRLGIESVQLSRSWVHASQGYNALSRQGFGRLQGI